MTLCQFNSFITLTYYSNQNHLTCYRTPWEQNPQVQHCSQQRLYLDMILCQFHPPPILAIHLHNIHFNFVLSFLSVIKVTTITFTFLISPSNLNMQAKPISSTLVSLYVPSVHTDMCSPILGSSTEQLACSYYQLLEDMNKQVKAVVVEKVAGEELQKSETCLT